MKSKKQLPYFVKQLIIGLVMAAIAAIAYLYETYLK